MRPWFHPGSLLARVPLSATARSTVALIAGLLALGTTSALIAHACTSPPSSTAAAATSGTTRANASANATASAVATTTKPAAAPTPTPTPTPAPAPTPTPTPGPLTITESSVTLMPVGKWDRKGEGDKKDYLWWSIRNASPKKLLGLTVTIYYYDLKQKQIGRKSFDQKLEVPPGATRELQIGPAKQHEPRGTQYRDAVFSRAQFEGGINFDDASQAPEEKPYRGAMPVPTPD